MSGTVYGSEQGGTYGGREGFTYGGTDVPDSAPVGTGWLLSFDASEQSTIYADGLVGELPLPIQGESAEYTFYFRRSDRGASAVTRRRQVRSRLANTASVVTYNGPDTTFYREQHAGPSLLVQVIAGTEITGTAGFWGLITGGEDPTTSARTSGTAALSIEMVYLAPLAAYDSHAGARAAHERSGL